jgi:amidase
VAHLRSRRWAPLVSPVPSAAAVALLALAAVLTTPTTAVAQIEVAEASIAELQEAMASGRTTSVEITSAYLARIAAYDQAGPRINAIIRVNPNALADAERLDEERRLRGPRGPLHGVPVILKDNYDVLGMPTTAGSLALAGSLPPDDAFQVRRLREAGAVILAKANLHELAYGITTIASLGGQTLNPYDLARNPGGSSGGTGAAIAASFAAIGWGSDTCGSIRIPASHNNLVGLRPTKGLSSIDGIIPLAHTQDVGGPLARTVPDLAVGLDATVGADPSDRATEALRGRTLPRFADALDPDALRGARIGILAELFGTTPEEAPVTAVVRERIARMVALGADTVTVEVPDFQRLIAGSSVIAHEFKWDLEDYLATVPDAPVRTLEEMLALGLNHEALVPTLRRSTAPRERDTPAYREALARREPLARAVTATMDAHGLDALVYPTIRTVAAHIGEPQRGSNCQLSATTGLPTLSAPAGWASGMPVGIELLGRAFDDARLLAIAYALEQADGLRRAPLTTPPLVDGAAPTPRVVELEAAGAAPADGEVWARFAYDPPSGVLLYDVSVFGVTEDDVFALVLRHADGGAGSVVARLAGPGVLDTNGSLTLDATMRARLERGELLLELVTRNAPRGAARVRVVLDGI